MAGKRYVVLSAVGADRPGLVDAVSKFILDFGCNLEDSRMAVLGGEFAMLILVAGDAAPVDAMLSELEAARELLGVTIHARATQAPRAERGDGGDAVPYRVDAYALDHPGIVQRIAHYLAGEEINIRSLDTHRYFAPHSGSPLFSLHATIEIPGSAQVNYVRRGFETIATQENIDIELRPYRSSG